jgi:hypothetical protein
MSKLSTEATLLTRDATRDLNAELLEAIVDIQSGKFGRVSLVNESGEVRELTEVDYNDTKPLCIVNWLDTSRP